MSGTKKPDKFGDTMIISYDPDSDEDGEVIWDGEAEGLGIEHKKTYPRPDYMKNVDYPAEAPATDTARRKRSK